MMVIKGPPSKTQRRKIMQFPATRKTGDCTHDFFINAQLQSSTKEKRQEKESNDKARTTSGCEWARGGLPTQVVLGSCCVHPPGLYPNTTKPYPSCHTEGTLGKGGGRRGASEVLIVQLFSYIYIFHASGAIPRTWSTRKRPYTRNVSQSTVNVIYAYAYLMPYPTYYQ